MFQSKLFLKSCFIRNQWLIIINLVDGKIIFSLSVSVSDLFGKPLVKIFNIRNLFRLCKSEHKLYKVVNKRITYYRWRDFAILTE